MKGQIKFYYEDKSFGFVINPDESDGQDYFFHSRDLIGVGTIEEGQLVDFEPYAGTRGLRARRVRPIEG